jgi:NADH:ubiquinone oxidoreductase subunit 3 (subunit A)
MVAISYLLLISFLLVLVLKLVSIIISERVSVNREELSPYECGFEHHNVSRIPLSLRYFILTLLFLLFDLEIIFLLFLPQGVQSFSGNFLLFSSLFILFLVLSLVYEWADGTLE